MTQSKSTSAYSLIIIIIRINFCIYFITFSR